MVQDRQFPKVEVSFAPAWWHARYGMDFGRAAWQDAVQATEWERTQRRLLYERFGDVGLGEADPAPHPYAGNEYAHRFMSAFWGCDVAYMSDQYPAAVPLPDARRRMEHIAVPDVASSPAVQLAFRNARRLEEKYGTVSCGINFGGPLNNAVSVLGEEIMWACAAEPDLARRVLRAMGEAVLAVWDQVACPINGIPPAEARRREWNIGNCPVCTISPATYTAVVLPADRWLRDEFTGEGFSLHHCGRLTRYLEAYRPLNPTVIDVGSWRDVAATRRAYPRAVISTYFEPALVAGTSCAESDAMIAQVIEDGRPVALLDYIRVIEVGPDFPDEVVRNLATAHTRLRL